MRADVQIDILITILCTPPSSEVMMSRPIGSFARGGMLFQSLD